MNKVSVYWFLVLAMVLWGANVVAAKYVIREISPVVATLLRFSFFSFSLGLWLWWREGRGAIPERRHFPALIAMGVFGTLLNNVLQFTGLLYSTAANCVVLSLIGPPVTAMLSSVFLHERLGPRGWAGLALSAVGVLILVSGGSWETLRTLTFNWGDILLILSFLSWSGYSIVGRKVMRELPAMVTTFWASGIGTLLVLLLAIREGFDGRVSMSGENWAAMGYMAFGSGLVAFSLWNISVRKVGASRASVFINILPLTGILMSYLILGEEIGWNHIIGGSWIAAGVWLTTQV